MNQPGFTNAWLKLNCISRVVILEISRYPQHGFLYQVFLPRRIQGCTSKATRGTHYRNGILQVGRNLQNLMRIFLRFSEETPGLPMLHYVLHSKFYCVSFLFVSEDVVFLIHLHVPSQHGFP